MNRIRRQYVGFNPALGTRCGGAAGHILARKLETITASEIKRAYAEAKDDDGLLHRAMAALQMAGGLGEREDNPSKRSIAWPVNPLVHERYAAQAAAEARRRASEVQKISKAAERLRKIATGEV